jgi:(E)-4-hydroxy-3-methylbut-2-enyl-diphosphate synthase
MKMDYFNYTRRPTVEVRVGSLFMGGKQPVVVQTMTNTNTLDVEGSVAQCERLIAAGAHLIRLTTQGTREVESLREIHRRLRDKGYSVPLSADIHFNPRAAEFAATIVEKVRINPGNFADRQRISAPEEYSDEEYARGVERVRAKAIPFYQICKEHGTAVRIGVNHGSLSGRIMARYGDTPEGMVESCMEYLRVAVEVGFTDIVISMKASNTLLMTKAVRLLVREMDREGMCFPLHLGVTEAGDGEGGRMKSAVGIGALLSDGLGDTIRVSLSEDPEAELPVARKLIDYVSSRAGHAPIKGRAYPRFSPYSIDRRETVAVSNIGGGQLPVVISDRSQVADLSLYPRFIPDYIYVGRRVPSNFPIGVDLIVDYPGWIEYVRKEEPLACYPLFTVESLKEVGNCKAPVKFLRVTYPELSDKLLTFLKTTPGLVIILATDHLNGVGEQRAFFHALMNADCPVPVILHRTYAEEVAEDIQIKGGVDFGTLLLDGFGNGIMMSNQGKVGITDLDSYAFGILQASRVRMSRTEFISCPGCGRTLFDLQATLAQVKQHLSHLTHLKIGVMGCIVNGPGEMADADYGYVGAERGKISLYRKKELVKKNIPQEEAVEELIRLIKEHGDWIKPG